VGHTFDVPAQMARQLSAIPSTEPIALWSGPPHSFPERRWVAYFLAGRRLVADWSSDEYLRPGLPPGAAQPAARWRIERGFADPAAGQGVRIGGLILGSAAPRFALLSAAGGYDQERDESGWWYWTARELRFHLRAEGGAPPQARLRLRYLLAPASRQVSVRITSGGREVSFALPAVEGWQDYQSEPLPIAGPSDVIVVFTTTGAPVRISDSDPRLMAFLIKNLVVEP
jgi:hypothetical protein